jgi:hypothetical protein
MSGYLKNIKKNFSGFSQKRDGKFGCFSPVFHKKGAENLVVFWYMSQK